MAKRPDKPKPAQTTRFKRTESKPRTTRRKTTQPTGQNPINPMQNNRLIRITRKNILTGRRQSYENCPIGQGMTDAGYRAGVTRDSMIINLDTDQQLEISLHQELSQWIASWDRGNRMNPINFLVNLEYRTTLPAPPTPPAGRRPADPPTGPGRSPATPINQKGA